MNLYKDPLHEMVMTTPTRYWNDSCSADELDYAIARGATGATSNPVIVFNVLKQNMPTIFSKWSMIIQPGRKLW